jgi:hypothetical protein
MTDIADKCPGCPGCPSCACRIAQAGRGWPAQQPHHHLRVVENLRLQARHQQQRRAARQGEGVRTFNRAADWRADGRHLGRCVLANQQTGRQAVSGDAKTAFGGYCRCGAPGTTMMFEGFVKTGRQLWFCDAHRPDYRALRIAHFKANGRWPPNRDVQVALIAPWLYRSRPALRLASSPPADFIDLLQRARARGADCDIVTTEHEQG